MRCAALRAPRHAHGRALVGCGARGGARCARSCPARQRATPCRPPAIPPACLLVWSAAASSRAPSPAAPPCAQLIGHVPMLADPDFGAMVQAIGQASLGADEATIWHLTKVGAPCKCPVIPQQTSHSRQMLPWPGCRPLWRRQAGLRACLLSSCPLPNAVIQAPHYPAATPSHAPLLPPSTPAARRRPRCTGIPLNSAWCARVQASRPSAPACSAATASWSGWRPARRSYCRSTLMQSSPR
jgi:hypothetical protein